MGIKEIEHLLKRIEFDKKELQVSLGKDRYEKVVNEINETFNRNGLNEFNKIHLLNHLNDISRVERIRV